MIVGNLKNDVGGHKVISIDESLSFRIFRMFVPECRRIRKKFFINWIYSIKKPTLISLFYSFNDKAPCFIEFIKIADGW